LMYSVVLSTALPFTVFCVNICISTLPGMNNHTLTVTQVIVEMRL
jgi:hypothetical protein